MDLKKIIFFCNNREKASWEDNYGAFVVKNPSSDLLFTRFLRKITGYTEIFVDILFTIQP